jgi:hypothetical protein
MHPDNPPFSDPDEAKEEILQACYDQYLRLLHDAPELNGKLRFESFLRFSFDFDRQQSLQARRATNGRRPN